MAKRFFWVALGIIVGAAGFALAQQAVKEKPNGSLKQRVLLEQVLPEKLDGKDAKVTVLELERAPDSAGAAHRHPGPVFVYVLDGELESAIDDQAPKVYTKGQMFYEPPRALHRVSRNPSKNAPVRFLAFLLTDKDAKKLVLPEKP